MQDLPGRFVLVSLISPSAYLFALVVVVGGVGVVPFGLVPKLVFHPLRRFICLSMLTLHKEDVREADITPFQGRGRPPVHNAGDVPIRAMVMNCPQASEFTIPAIWPTREEEAAVENDMGRTTHPYESHGSEAHQPQTCRFYTSKDKKHREVPWKITYAANSDRRAYTPDPRALASVAENMRVEQGRLFVEQNAELLETNYTAWMQACAENPDAEPEYWPLPQPEPLPLAAVVVTPARRAAGRISVAQD